MKLIIERQTPCKTTRLGFLFPTNAKKKRKKEISKPNTRRRLPLLLSFFFTFSCVDFLLYFNARSLNAALNSFVAHTCPLHTELCVHICPPSLNEMFQGIKEKTGALVP